MYESTLRDHRYDVRHGCLCLMGAMGAWVLAVAGCSPPPERAAQPVPELAVENRPGQLWQIPSPTGRAGASTTRPAATRPAQIEPVDPLTPPYRLNTENIVQLLYHKSPLVASSRESMIAAQHGLEEFKANLSRFEPFAEFDSNTSRFPKRQDARRVAGEAVGGIEKETFDGAIVRVEGGASGERVRFGDVAEGEDEVEQGSGGLVRGRFEVPFVGSRKRQDRVISAAFQESTARGAVLRYLSNYRDYVSYALSYYDSSLYYLNYARVYEKKREIVDSLLNDARVRPEDRQRLEAVAGDTKVLIEQQMSYYRSAVLSLLQYLGIQPEEEYVLEEPPLDAPSRYYDLTLSPEGEQEMLTQAFENNPTFGVLGGAIKDAELKRSQAIQGKYDFTAFVEGTQYAFGAETFDDRVGGWEAGGGLTFRLNDPRVLTASQKKAEAEIRSYRAQIEAERLSVQRQIANESNVLRSYLESRPQIHENIEKSRAEFEERSKTYLTKVDSPLTIDDVLNSLASWIAAEFRLATNVYYASDAESDLMAATGEVYRLVGMQMVEDGNGVKLPVTE